jgi:hypothetical protein
LRPPTPSSSCSSSWYVPSTSLHSATPANSQATANHYFLDAVGGFFVTILAFRVNRILLNLRPIEEWAFWLVRTERPMDKAKYEAVLSRQNAGQRDEAGRPLMSDSA